MRVYPGNDTYDTILESNLEPPYGNFSTNITLGILCEGNEQLVYNRTGSQNGVTDNASTYMRTDESGGTSTVQGVPNRIYNTYTPRRVEAAVYTENGTTVLESCTVDGKGSWEFD
ncbi:hypothetical protein NDI56_04190 [Haloarcula sp. S1CR25-12]|uniref:Uncharacterized protein n=1 Tax=Haloarcula saliterrae TaxID=2950534 RepID=A0ABU2F8Q7_9EURY|nr:hypothetical protein [Haloarcula sp. S1CR25-12]